MDRNAVINLKIVSKFFLVLALMSCADAALAQDLPVYDSGNRVAALKLDQDSTIGAYISLELQVDGIAQRLELKRPRFNAGSAVKSIRYLDKHDLWVVSDGGSRFHDQASLINVQERRNIKTFVGTNFTFTSDALHVAYLYDRWAPREMNHRDFILVDDQVVYPILSAASFGERGQLTSLSDGTDIDKIYTGTFPMIDGNSLHWTGSNTLTFLECPVWDYESDRPRSRYRAFTVDDIFKEIGYFSRRAKKVALSEVDAAKVATLESLDKAGARAEYTSYLKKSGLD